MVKGEGNHTLFSPKTQIVLFVNFGYANKGLYDSSDTIDCVVVLAMTAAS